MNPIEQDPELRDARRYRMLRMLLCASPEVQEQVHALIAPVLAGHADLVPGVIDRALDLALERMKIL